MNGRSRSRVLALGVGLLVPFVPAAVSTATPTPPPPAEAYPPAAIVNLLDPFDCAPASISGDIGAVLAGSTVTLQLLFLGGAAGESLIMLQPVATVTVTAGADGHAVYTIPVPPNRFGPVVVRANGINTVNQPFALETSGTIVDCPDTLPATGNSGIGDWLRGGTALVLAGVALVVVALRHRRHALGGVG